MVKRKIFILLFLISALYLFKAHAQTNVEFGQNRVQYHEFEWQFYQTENFTTYFYLGGQELGKFAAQIAEKDYADIQSRLEYRMNHKIEILVYNTLSDLKQSNIGIATEEQNTGGVTKIIGNKAFVFFNGNHLDLERQIKEGIAKIFINDMLFGGNIQDVLQNAVLLNLPEWFIDGLVAYSGEEWSVDLDNRLRDGILSGNFKKFSSVSNTNSRFAGHSFWYYVAEKYGQGAIPNLLYLTRINRSLESGFLYVIGMPVNRALRDWYEFFHSKYASEEKEDKLPPDANKIPVRTFQKYFYRDLKSNPDASEIAFVTNQLGRYKVNVFHVNRKKNKVIMRGGFRSVTQQPDFIYPMVAWAPERKKLAVLYERRNKIKLLVYDFDARRKKKTRTTFTKFQNVLSIAYMNPQTLVISAVNKGQSDIYTYHLPSSKVEQLTNDYYDDLQPNFVKFESKDKSEPSRQGITFISNRTDDTLRSEQINTELPTGNFDVFFYDYINRKKTLLQVTHTPDISENLPMQYNNNHICYLSDKNGVRNRYASYFETIFSGYDTVIYYRDSVLTNPVDYNKRISIEKNLIDSVGIYPVYNDTAYSFPVTDYSRNIFGQDVSLKAAKVSELFLYNNQFYFYRNNIPKKLSAEIGVQLENTSFRTKNALNSLPNKNNGNQPAESKLEIITKDSSKIDINNYYFQTEFIQTEITKTDTLKNNSSSSIETQNAAQKEKPVIQLGKIRLYHLKFATDYIVTQMDNSIIFNQYQSFGPNGGTYNNPDLNALIKIGISDVFEDYKVVAGFRLPTSFGGNEYFLQFDNLKKRLDKRFVYYRKSDFASYESLFSFDPINARLKTNFFQVSLSYPLDIPRSLKLHVGYRNDKVVFLADDPLSLELKNFNEHWGLVKAEFVFDNTIKTGVNLRNGTRYKLYTEYHQQMNDNEDHFKLSGNVAVAGFDFRRYQKVHRQIIWATRLNAATSFGLGNSINHRKIVYYLGGVNNWLIPRFDTDVPVSFTSGYAYQSLATNLRGFEYNVRNGNSFALVNTEIRFPIFTYLFKRPIRTDFIRNFQLIGFLDAGTAWEGLSPFSQDNPFNTVTLPEDPQYRNPIYVKVNYFRNPLVAGYGIGARTLIFGYFMRGDLAWGNDNGIKQKPIFYFSMSLDF